MEKDIIQQAFDAHTSGNKREEAILLYRKALAKFPEDKRLYINLGALLRAEGHAEEAAQILQTGLVKLKQESPAILNNLGNALRDLARYPEAASMYIRALKQNKNYLDADGSLYACYREMGLHRLSKIYLRMLHIKYAHKPNEIKSLIVNHEIQESQREQRELNPKLQKLLEELDFTNKNDNSERNLPQH